MGCLKSSCNPQLLFLVSRANGAGEEVGFIRVLNREYKVVQLANLHYSATHNAALATKQQGHVNDSFINKKDGFSDVALAVEGTLLHAHRLILSARSEYFSALFRSGMRESEEGVVHTPKNTKRSTALLLLKFLYTDSVQISFEQALPLYALGQFYYLDNLKDLCTAALRDTLTPENVGPLLQEAADFGFDKLKDICLEFMAKHFDQASMTAGMQAVSRHLLFEIFSARARKEKK